MRRIRLRGKAGEGLFASVDDEDFEWLNKYKWYANKNKGSRTIYATTQLTRNKTRITRRMHRLIMGEPKHDIDHADGNGLNNQKDNLRSCTRSQNNMNMCKRKGSKTKYKGVTFDPRDGRYYVRVHFNGRAISCGGFDDGRSAAMAYDKKALELYGEFAHPNFQFDNHQ